MSLDIFYKKQVDFTKNILGEILASIDNGGEPIVAIFNACKQSQAISYADHSQVIEEFRERW